MNIDNQLIDNISKERKLLFKDSTLSFLRMIITTISNYVILMLIVKGLGSDGYGTLTQFTVTSFLMLAVASLNLGHSMSRFLPAEQEAKEASKTFTAVLLCVILSALVVSVIVYFFRHNINPLVFGNNYEEWLWVALIVYFLFLCIQSEVEALLKALRYLKSLIIIDIIVSIITIAAYAFIIHSYRSLFWIIWATVLINVTKAVIFIIFQYSKGLFLCRPNFGVLKSYLSFGAPLLIMGFGFMMVQYAGRYIINIYHGIAAVGTYSILYAFSSLIVFYWNAGNSVFLPDLSYLYDNNRKEEVEYRFSKVVMLGLAIMIPAMLGLSVIKDDLFILIGDRYLMAETYTLQILCLAFVGYGIILALSLLINLLKKSIWLGNVWVILAFINIILNLLLVPKYGILGSAISALICFGGGSILLVLETRKHFKIHLSLGQIFKIAIAAFVLLALLEAVHLPGKLGLILKIIMGAVVYSAVLLITGFIEKSEVQYIINTIRNKMNIVA